MSHENEDLDALFESIAAEVSAEKSVSEKTEHEVPVSLVSVADGKKNEQKDAESTEAPDDLYGRLGSIVRNLHDSLRELGLDKSLSESAIKINDAEDRLVYIATLTEKAANTVLNTLDQAIPAQTVLSTRAAEINAAWKEMFAGNLSIESFKKLAQDSMQFSEDVQKEAEVEKARLLEIMMAQDFQDLTGQIIKKVIVVTKDVEKDLAQLLKDNAPPEVKERVQKEKQLDLMAGPAVPAQAMAQDDVDNLLDGLGF